MCLCSINIVMTPLRLWSHVPFCLLWWCEFSNILEEHGCHFWFNSWWSIRVDPCSLYISLYILSILCEFTVYLLTLMKLSIQYLCHQLITINVMIRNNSTMLLSLESLFFISISIYSPYYN